MVHLALAIALTVKWQEYMILGILALFVMLVVVVIGVAGIDPAQICPIGPCHGILRWALPVR